MTPIVYRCSVCGGELDDYHRGAPTLQPCPLCGAFTPEATSEKPLSQRLRDEFRALGYIFETKDRLELHSETNLLCNEVEALEAEVKTLEDNLRIEMLEGALNSRDYWKTAAESAEKSNKEMAEYIEKLLFDLNALGLQKENTEARLREAEGVFVKLCNEFGCGITPNNADCFECQNYTLLSVLRGESALYGGDKLAEADEKEKEGV